jgi:hypothetical protein
MYLAGLASLVRTGAFLRVEDLKGAPLGQALHANIRLVSNALKILRT